MEVESTCPYCGEPVSLFVDISGGSRQSYVEDCAVCCNPWQVEVANAGEEDISVALSRLDD